ncbi:MAG: hypothetical protein IJS08_04395, partial [Victivallales bacterium]|nr:hypothetical protein [Victivallales bacterium]
YYQLDSKHLVPQEDHSWAFEVNVEAIPNDGLFVFRLPANFAVPIDETSRYNRTEIFIGEENYPYMGELAMEITWKL